MKQTISNLLSKQINLSKKEIESTLEIPPSPELGDYAFPCFSLAEKLKKNPNQIANELVKKISSKDFEKIEAKGPYINFFIDRKKLANQILARILKEKDKFGKSNYSKEKVMIEFSQANTHKAFHIGHVRGTALGESLARIAEFSGSKVIRANYQGDTGMHVAKWLWCYQKFHSKEALKQDEAWIASIYVDSVQKLEKNPEYQSEIEEINRKLDSKEDKKLNDLWKKTRKLSLNAFEKIYKDLDTKFNHYFFESEVEKRGREISEELVKKGIAEISEGAAIVRLENFNLGVWVLLRKDGTVLYSAKDLALAERKFEDLKIDSSIYVVGSAQKQHFYQLFKTLELMGFKKAKNCKYVPVSEVRFPWGKMSSRTGENILYSGFKKELVDCSKKEILERHSLKRGDLEKRALAIAIAALKYQMLKQDTNKTLIFEKEEAMKFEGHTGPYLLYTYARAKSILRKAKKSSEKLITPELTETEKALAFQLSLFPEIVKKAFESLSPNIIANYAHQIAQSFNEFYHSNKVIGSEEESFRRALVEAFSQTLKNALNLLGIQPLERM